MTLYLLHYCNYFNRIVKTEVSLADYLDYSLGSIENVNFNPSDGVDTEQIINWSGDTPDYVVCVNEQSQIDSRWFVIEASRTRGLQYLLKLKRDVIADNLASFMQSTAFIERGYVDNSNPLVFNSEGMSLNQIKQGELLLKNQIESPWLVLYLSRYDGEGKLYNYQGRFTASFNSDIEEYDDLSDYPYYQFTGSHYYVSDQAIVFGGMCETYDADYGDGTAPYRRFVYGLGWGGNAYYAGTTHHANPQNYPDVPGRIQSPAGATLSFSNAMTAYRAANSTVAPGVVENSYTGWTNADGFNTVMGENNKVVKAGGNYYRITVTSRTVAQTSIPTSFFNAALVDVSTSSSLGTTIRGFFDDMVELSGKTFQPVVYINNGTTTANWINEFSLTWQLLSNYAETDASYNFTFPGVVTRDAVYEIIAAPLYDMTITRPSGTTIEHRGEVALQWFQDIMSRYGGSGAAYDLQLLPYCPIDTTNWSDYEVYHVSSTTGLNPALACCVNLPTSSFNTTINVTLPTYIQDNKVGNETWVYRLVSPNGVGDYEFSPNKNGGLTSIHVDCTLKPYNPYIQIHPVWGWMYGNSSQEDFRGLICQGDFSLPATTNEWASFELQNKNFQAVFDRSIQSQDYQREWGRASDIVGAISGSFGGVAGGAIAGSVAGPGGAIAGAVAGGALSVAGGVADVIANEKIYQEQKQASIETFQMQLGNVKARAQTLSRGTSYNVDSKYFPFIEYYTCTQQELDSFNNYIKYKGMAVGVIGQIQDYLNPEDTTYIQGKLIDIDITDDYHMAREIANVLRGGIRIYA